MDIEAFYIRKLDQEFHPNDPHRPERRVFFVDIGHTPCETALKLFTEYMNKDRNDR